MAILKYRNPKYTEGGDQPQWLNVFAYTDREYVLNNAKMYTDNAVADLIDSAPDTLNTLGELATAIKDNQDVIEAIDNAITDKLDRTEAASTYATKAESVIGNGVVTLIVYMTQSEYDALETKDPTTLYLISE